MVVIPFVPVAVAGDTLPDVPLVDQSARPLSLRGAGHGSIVTFAYTRCPDADGCDLVTGKFARLATLLAGTHIRLIEVTLDPRNDTPAVLRDYAKRVRADSRSWSFATGTVAHVAELSQRLGIVETISRSGSIEHSDAVALLSPHGEIIESVDGMSWSPDAIAASARAAAGAPSNPLSALVSRLMAGASAICGAGGSGGASSVTTLALLGGLVAAFGYVAVRVFASVFGGPAA